MLPITGNVREWAKNPCLFTSIFHSPGADKAQKNHEKMKKLDIAPMCGYICHQVVAILAIPVPLWRSLAPSAPPRISKSQRSITIRRTGVTNVPHGEASTFHRCHGDRHCRNELRHFVCKWRAHPAGRPKAQGHQAFLRCSHYSGCSPTKGSEAVFRRTDYPGRAASVTLLALFRLHALTPSTWNGGGGGFALVRSSLLPGNPTARLLHSQKNGI